MCVLVCVCVSASDLFSQPPKPEWVTSYAPTQTLSLDHARPLPWLTCLIATLFPPRVGTRICSLYVVGALLTARG